MNYKKITALPGKAIVKIVSFLNYTNTDHFLQAIENLDLQNEHLDVKTLRNNSLDEKLKQGFFITPEGLAHRTNPDKLRFKKISKKDIETEVTLSNSCVFSTQKPIEQVESILYKKVKKIN